MEGIFEAGKMVLSPFGQALVTGFREEDKMYEVTLNGWKLADGKSPKLYAPAESLKAVSESTSSDPQNEQPSTTSSSENTVRANDDNKDADNSLKYVEICIKEAAEAKEKATKEFNAKNYDGAKSLYLDALSKLLYMGDENFQLQLPNEQKAKIIELQVPCNNNISLCCWFTKNYSDSVLHAQEALKLIKSLESRLPDSKVWQCLEKNGMTRAKLCVDMKSKALFYMGRASVQKGDYQEAVDSLSQAIKLNSVDEGSAGGGTPSKNNEGSEANSSKDAGIVAKCKTELARAKQLLAKEVKKEKSVWSNAFEKNKSIDTDNGTSSSSSSSSPSSPSRGKDKDKAGNASKKHDKKDDNNSVHSIIAKIFSAASSFLGLSNANTNANSTKNKSNQVTVYQPSTFSVMKWVVGVTTGVGICVMGTMWLRKREFRFRN